MKNRLCFISVLTVIILFISSFTAFANGFTIDTSRVYQGVFEVEGVPSANIIRVIVEKEGTRDRYIYFLSKVNQNVFPLQLGDGRYTITLLENVIRNESKKILAETVDVRGINQSVLFTQSIQLVDFASSEAAIPSFHEMLMAAGSDEEKLSIVYEYIIDNIDYDFEKIPENLFDYLPVIDDTYLTQKGICYDYAALMAGALRSRGIPTKLQKGYTSKIPSVYHAWNAVFLGGSWYKVDTTYDRQLRKADLDVSMIKDDEIFTVVREF